MKLDEIDRKQTDLFYGVAAQAAKWHEMYVKAATERDVLLAACEAMLEHNWNERTAMALNARQMAVEAVALARSTGGTAPP